MSLTLAVVFIVVHVVLLYCVAFVLSRKLYEYRRKQYDKMLERRKNPLMILKQHVRIENQ